MKFDDLLSIVGDEPVFETGLLLAGDISAAYLRRQLTEWVNVGKLNQLRRGLYALAAPYQRTPPHPFLVANRLSPGSYVSLQASLAYDHLIPEHEAAVTSVTGRRPGTWDTPYGCFHYRRVQPDLLFGYEIRPLGDGQSAFVATPAKALLDLVYLQPGGDSLEFLEGLRLQNLDQLDTTLLLRLAQESGRPKLQRAAKQIVGLARRESEEYQPL